MRRINILLPENLYQAFSARCDEANVTMASVVRAIIDREMGEPSLTVKQRSEMSVDQKQISAIRKGEAEKRKREIISAVLNEGALLKDVASRYGMSKSGVSKILSRAGVRAPG